MGRYILTAICSCCVGSGSAYFMFTTNYGAGGALLSIGTLFALLRAIEADPRS